MIENIIFDMGQVLIRWEPDLLTAHLKLSEADNTLVKTQVFASVQWVQLDRGTISEEDATAVVCKRLPEHLHEAAETLICDWWKRPLVPMPGMEALIRELKGKGYGIYLLSNASLRLRSYFHRIPGADCFDGLLVSSEERLLKPQHEIFETLYSRFGLDPEKCFFIDDSPANVEGALRTGMEGTVFRGDTQALREELRERNIL